MPNPSSPPRSVKLRSLLGGVALALALLVPAANAAAWVKEPAPAVGSFFQQESSLSVLPDGSVRWIGSFGSSNPYTDRLIVRPPAGPASLASPFPTALGQDDSDDILFLSPQDAGGNQLVVREASPYLSGWLAANGNPGTVAALPNDHVTAIDLAPSGEAAAIISEGSTAAVTFRAAGPGGSFDTPRPLDRAGNMFSYAIAITLDPDGGIFALYRTGQEPAVLQAYAPPGEDFGAPQLVDIAKADIESVVFGQSTNGHGTLTWDEDTGGSTNSELVWAMARAPGGLLGGKSLVATARPNGVVSAIHAAATDDGTQYVSYLDSGPIVCPSPNNSREGGGVLARRSAGGAWTNLNLPSTGNERFDIRAIATAGNAVGVLSGRSLSADKCVSGDPSSSLEVQLGQGAGLGPAQTVAAENITNGKYSTVVRPHGFAVNASGAAALLVEEPYDPANNSSPYLYFQAPGAPTPPAPAPAPGPAPAPQGPLKAPGKIKLSGKKLAARGGEVPFEASCMRLPNEGNKVFCSIAAILMLDENERKGKIVKPTASAAKGKAKPKVIATAKAVKVPAGKTKEVTLKLNKLGKQKLAAAKKAGLKVTLKVTINRAGYATNTIEKKVKLVAGKGKGSK